MSLRHLHDGQTNRKVLLAVALAIKNLERVTGTIVEYDITRDDAEALCSAMTNLWSILETNGYTIDADTNHLRKVPP